MTMKMKLAPLVTALATAVTTVLMTASAFASPAYVNYQGTINDSSGNPINNNNQPLTFNIYDTATSGVLVWGPFNVTAPVVNGRFNVILGPNDTASRSLDTVFSGSDNRYLAVTVGATTISPRQRFLANPYAYTASSVGNAAYQLTPTNFAVLNNNTLEFGKGVANKFAGNATLSYNSDSLNLVGGGTNAASRRTTVQGNLVVANGTVTAGTISTPIITDGSGRTLNLSDLIAELYPLPAKYTNVSLADTLYARGFEVDLSRFVTNGYDCRLDFHLQHETSDDLVRSSFVNLAFEDANLGNTNVIGLQGFIHGTFVGGEVYNYGNLTLDTTTRVTLASLNDTWAYIFNFKPAILNGAPVKDSNGTTITTNSDAYQGADRYKIFVVFHQLISGRLTVRKQ